MAIVASAVIEDAPQADGRRYVTEAHTDHLGVVHRVTVLVPADWEPDLPARAAQIEARLAAAEIEANLSEIEGG